MHGVIVFSTRSGACLFARAFTQNFGLHGDWSTHGDGASTSPTGRSFGAMQLAGLLFAIRAYAEDLAVPEGRGGSKDAEERPSEGGPDRASRIAPSETRRFARTSPHDAGPEAHRKARDANEKKTRAPGALRRWVSGDVSIAFAERASRGIAVAVFAHVDVGAALPAKIAAALLDEFARKHDVGFAGVAGAYGEAAPSKSLTFAAEVEECVLAAPAEVARELAASADVGSTWVYVGFEDARRGAGGTRAEDPDAKGDDDAKRRAGKENRHPGGVLRGASRSRDARVRRRGRVSGSACFGFCRATDGATRDAPRDERTPDARFGDEDEDRDEDEDEDAEDGSKTNAPGKKTVARRPRVSFVASCAPARVAGDRPSAWSLPMSEETACAIATEARRCFVASLRDTSGADDAEGRAIDVGSFALDEKKKRNVASSRSGKLLAFRRGRLLVALPDETEDDASTRSAARLRGRVAADAARLARLMAFAEGVADARRGPLAFAGAARLDRRLVEGG